MIGTDRARFCGQCSLNVYNLSAMTAQEAEDLISRTEGRLCVRFFRRADGSVLTQNCPVGFAAVRARLKRRATAVVTGVMTFLSGVGLFSVFGELGGQGTIIERMRVSITRTLRTEEPIMGEMVSRPRRDVVITRPEFDHRSPRRKK
jgi:hypothetical protein